MELKLRPSSTIRAIKCPGSTRFIESLPQREWPPSIYAAEGTVAHTIGEDCLDNDRDASDYIGDEYTEDGFTFIVDEAMAEAVQVYVDYVREVRDCPLTIDGKLFTEVKCHLRKLGIPELIGGTSDAVITMEGEIHIIDYKHGAGKQVYPERNPQALSYALGACLEKGYDPLRDKVQIFVTIVQPRTREAAQRGNKGIETWSCTIGELYVWAQDVLIPAALNTRDPDAPLVVSDEGCTFCPAESNCPAKNQQLMTAATDEFGAINTDIKTLSDEQKAFILTNSSALKKFIDAVEEDVKSRLMSDAHAHFEGFKLVRGKSNRRFTTKAEEKLKCVLDKEDVLKPAQLKGIGDIEKALKAKGLKPKQVKEVMDEITFKPKGSVSLVPDTDKRPGLNQSASVEFKDHI